MAETVSAHVSDELFQKIQEKKDRLFNGKRSAYIADVLERDIAGTTKPISSENENAFLDACSQFCNWTTRQHAESLVNDLEIDQRELLNIILDQTVNILRIIHEEEKDWRGIMCIHKDKEGYTGIVKTKPNSQQTSKMAS